MLIGVGAALRGFRASPVSSGSLGTVIVGLLNWMRDHWEALVALGAVMVSLLSLRVALQASSRAAGETISASFDSLVKTALSSGANLTQFDNLFFPHAAEDSVEQRRARWASLLALNAIERSYLGAKGRTLPREVARPITHDLLQALLENPTVADALESGYYEKSFERHGRRLMERRRDDA